MSDNDLRYITINISRAEFSACRNKDGMLDFHFDRARGLMEKALSHTSEGMASHAERREVMDEPMSEERLQYLRERFDKLSPTSRELLDDNDRLREQRDAERGEVARLRERLEQEMANTDQLQAANAVCEEAEAAVCASPNRRTALVELCKAWRATQKGGK